MIWMKSLFYIVAASIIAFPPAIAVSETLSVDTANVSAVFSDDSGSWELLHVGAKIISATDAATLAWRASLGGNWFAQRRPAAYSTYGDKALNRGLNYFGGLQATHADGCATTSLKADGFERIDEGKDVAHIVLKHKDRDYPFKVRQHFRAFADCDIIETWVEIENGESGSVRLGRMDSFAIDLPNPGSPLHLLSVVGQWAAEAQVSEIEIPRGQTVTIGSRGGIRDAWDANPAFMLSIGGRADETSGRVFGGALCWTGVWGASVQRDACDFVEIRAGVDASHGAYVLDAGEKIVLPKFAFTWSEQGKGQVSRNLHRWARLHHLPNGMKLRPVLLNSWEGSFFDFTEKTLHDMMDGAAEMGVEMFVLDDGWFGRGRYVRNEKNRETAGLGDWYVNKEKLPHGLDGLAAEAKNRGLGFGLWLAPEMANTNSWLYYEHPEWVLSEKRRPLYAGRGKSQVVLDLVNPIVRDNLLAQITAIFAEAPDIKYIKWDANADFMNIGSHYLDDAHQTNMPFDYTMSLYDLLRQIRERYATVDIQACASGGGHADYGFLAYADEFWGSDISDAAERVFIQWGESLFYPAQCIAAHVTKVPNHITKRITPLKYRFDVAMSGRLGIELHPGEMTAEELVFAKQCIADYKRIRPVVQQGDLYRLVSPYGGTHAALMYVNEDATRSVIFVYGLARNDHRDFPAPIPVRGLSEKRRYGIRELNMVNGKTHSPAVDTAVGGAAMMAMGLPVKLSGDYDSAVFELVAVPDGITGDR